MKLGVLFSGGKDSCYAMYLAMQRNQIACLITIIPENKESYMFHTPNIELAESQAEAIGLPIIIVQSKGEKEKELEDLKKALIKAKDKHEIEGVVTGALASVYQSSRIQKICDELKLECVNPIWGMDQLELLERLASNGFEIAITGIFGHPLKEELLGKKIDTKTIAYLREMHEKHEINPAGEGGEIETITLDGPFFKKKLVITESEKKMSNENSGILKIKKIRLVKK